MVSISTVVSEDPQPACNPVPLMVFDRSPGRGPLSGLANSADSPPAASPARVPPATGQSVPPATWAVQRCQRQCAVMAGEVSPTTSQRRTELPTPVGHSAPYLKIPVHTKYLPVPVFGPPLPGLRGRAHARL
jgi:hypothetical protein